MMSLVHGLVGWVSTAFSSHSLITLPSVFKACLLTRRVNYVSIWLQVDHLTRVTIPLSRNPLYTPGPSCSKVG